MPDELLTSLNENEKVWWKTTIKDFRRKLITEPKVYAVDILQSSWTNNEDMLNNLDEVIKHTRNEIWQLYLLDEANFHAKVLAHLFTERELPANILKQLLDHEHLISITDKNEFAKEIGILMGDYAGKVMPYIYELALSTTQSRRARAGKTFEQLVESLLAHFSIKYDTQGSVSSGIFSSAGLGKKVDAIVPSIEAYVSNRSKCAVVTMKTSLRERWQEVAEELSRTNIPHIYLLTVDEEVTENIVNTIKNYNIALVVYSSEKNNRFSKHDNVHSFYDFFTKEMQFIMRYWDN